MNDEVFIYFKDLLISERPQDFISPENWKLWTTSIYKTNWKGKYLKDVAINIGVYWPHIRRYDKISDYLPFDISKVLTIPGFGTKKCRSIILCIEYIALCEIQLNYRG